MGYAPEFKRGTACYSWGHPTFLPMVRSQVDFAPQEIMQWNIMEPNAGPNPNCTLKQPTWIFFTSHRKSINPEGLVVAANLETTMGFSSAFLKIPWSCGRTWEILVKPWRFKTVDCPASHVWLSEGIFIIWFLFTSDIHSIRNYKWVTMWGPHWVSVRVSLQ